VLSDLLAVVEPEINARSGLTVTFHTGPEFVRQEEIAPRIVWVPTRDTFHPPQGIGGSPRAVAIRQAGVESYLWGVDYAQTEILIHSAVMAIHRHAVGARIIESGEFQNISHDVRYGRGYLLTWNVWIPVADVVYAHAPSGVKGHILDAFEGSLEVGCEQVG
jgi:hypothetical protein